MDAVGAIFGAILSSPVTPISLSFAVIAGIFWGFFRGQIFSKFVVEQLLAAKDVHIANLEKALDIEKARNDKQFELITKLLTYAEAADKILKALPTGERQK